MIDPSQISSSQSMLSTLRTDVLGHADTLAAYNAGDRIALAALYNANASPEANVWDWNTPTDRIHDAIDYTKFTPVDAAAENLIGSQRLLMIQTKQMNLQNMLMGKASVDATKANLRAGLRDALINLPAGTSGANVQAAGASAVTAMTACTRPAKCSRLEKLFTTGQATTGTVTGELLLVAGQCNESLFVDV